MTRLVVLLKSEAARKESKHKGDLYLYDSMIGEFHGIKANMERNDQVNALLHDARNIGPGPVRSRSHTKGQVGS